MKGSGLLEHWPSPFNAPWLAVDTSFFLLQSHCSTQYMSCYVDSLVFNGTAKIHMISDPWNIYSRPVSLQGNDAAVSGGISGGSGVNFPHISAEIKISLSNENPGSLVRTIQQGSNGLLSEDPTCAATACQDLEFDLETITTVQAIFSTWDSSVFQASLNFIVEVLSACL